MTLRAVDLFSGFGGFSLGASMAGVDVVWAANHWQLAVDVHAANHPTTHHECQDLRQADWTSLPPYDLLMASPACQPHSSAANRAKANPSHEQKAKHEAMRTTAWAVVDCAELTQPRALIVENVPAFTRWQLYPLWKQALELLGYSLREHRLIATNHDVPQLRDRVFVVGLRQGKHFGMPLKLSAPPGFDECLEPDADGWRPVSAAPSDTRSRLLAARSNIGPRALVHHVTGHRGRSLREPIRTITTKALWTLLDGDRYRWLTPRELARGMGFPDSYTWPETLSREAVLRGLGNAVCPPVARDIVAAVGRAIS